MPILRGVRTSLDRVLRTPVKGYGVETIRGAFLRLPRSSYRASFAFPRAPPAGRAPHHVTSSWVGAMRPSLVVRSAGACLATRPGCSPRTLAPACTALLFPSCERRTLRASLGCDFVKPISATRCCARARLRAVDPLRVCRPPFGVRWSCARDVALEVRTPARAGRRAMPSVDVPRARLAMRVAPLRERVLRTMESPEEER